MGRLAEPEAYTIVIQKQNISAGSFSVGDYEDTELRSSSNSIIGQNLKTAIKAKAAKSIWEDFQEVIGTIPKSVLDELPADFDKEYSLIDCISMITMQERQIDQILTNDRHFSQEGFEILMSLSLRPF